MFMVDSVSTQLSSMSGVLSIATFGKNIESVVIYYCEWRDFQK